MIAVANRNLSIRWGFNVPGCDGGFLHDTISDEALSEKGSDPLVNRERRIEIGVVGKGQTPFLTKPRPFFTVASMMTLATCGIVQ